MTRLFWGIVCSILFVIIAVAILTPKEETTGDVKQLFFDGDFALYPPPGLHDQPFDLIVSIPSIPDTVIYYTIDGNEPTLGEGRFITRGNRLIQVSGRLPNDGKIGVYDRTGYWRYAILAYYSDVWDSRGGIMPADGTEILQGTSFRFRGFCKLSGEPVTETITATYIIAQNAHLRFNYMPIIAITAPYSDFFYIYYHSYRRDPMTRHRIFNYEYFEYEENGYSRIFSLLGSSGLGGNFSRNFAQRNINVNFARGQLDGVITHPIFEGLYELYRFRLWNGGSVFNRGFKRDAFVQLASARLNVQHSDSNLAIKFINGEFWGFTTMREHNSNRHFVSTRFGLATDNIAIVSNFGTIDEGKESIVAELVIQLHDFSMSHDLSTDYAVTRLFDDFLCQSNFMDYVISNTFFGNTDWISGRSLNNVRFFRAINPCQNSQNPYEDGRWRFILHDMDWSLGLGYTRYRENPFRYLQEFWTFPTHLGDYGNYIFQVFNNPVFVQQFVERAHYVLDNYFTQAQLLTMLDEFANKYIPLLPEMYNRFVIYSTTEESISRWHLNLQQVRNFLRTREYNYRSYLNDLLYSVFTFS